MTLQQLEYFRVMAKVLHYTRAAEALFISQPSLSYAISELEKELAVPLFEKKNNSICLSKYGTVFLEYTIKILDTVVESKRTLAQMLDPLCGEIVLGYFYNHYQDFLPGIINGFLKHQENGRNFFKLRRANYPTLISYLISGEVDVAFTFGLTHANICSVPLLSQELFLILPLAHEYSNTENCALSDIKDTPFILLNKNMHLRKYIDSIFEESDIAPEVIIETNDTHMILSLVESGRGASIVPYDPILETRDIRVLRISNPVCFCTIYISYSATRQISPQVQRFIDYVLEHYRYQLDYQQMI